MQQANTLLLTCLITFLCICSVGGEKSGNFLNIFNNCLIEFITDFQRLQHDKNQGDKLVYINYFRSKVPVIFSDVRSARRNLTQGSNIEPVHYAFETYRKWLDCYVQVYFVDLIVGSRGDYISIHKLLESSILASKDPHAVIFIKPRRSSLHLSSSSSSHPASSSSLVEGEKSLYSNLYRLTLSSMFIVIDGAKRQVNLVCMHCRGSLENQLKVIEETGKVKTLADLHQLWYNQHRNLLGRSVDAIKRRRRRREEDDDDYNEACDPFLHNHLKNQVPLQTDSNICAQLAIGQRLNFTPFVSNNDFRFYGHIKFGIMSYADYNEQTFLTRTNAKYEWLSSDEFFQAFVYATIVNKDALNISALWRVFEPRAWVAIVSTFVTLMLIFGLAISSKFEVMRNRLNNLRFSFILFTAILLEQTQLKIWKVKLQLNRVASVIIITWILAALTFSRLYRATIYTYLTTTIPPEIPSTTEQLVQSDFFLITSTSYHYLGKPYSTLVAILDEMMQGKSGADYPKFYEELEAKIHFTPSSPSNVVSAFKNKSPLLVIQRDSSKGSISFAKQQLNIPRNFAMIGSEFDVDVTAAMLEMEDDAPIFIQRSSTVHTFLNRMPWIIRRNFFRQIFQPSLAHLSESGHCDLWRQMGEEVEIQREFQLLAGLEFKGKNPRHFYRRERHDFSYKLNPKPLSLEVFDSAIVFHFICTITSLVVFLAEWTLIAAARFVWERPRNAVVPKRAYD